MATGLSRDADLAAWAAAQARLLRKERLGELDLPGLAAEIGAVAERQGALLDRHLAALLTRLLMWKYLPGARLPSWRSDVAEERRTIAGLTAASPGLAGRAAAVFAVAYGTGRLRAAAETGIDVGLLPEVPPFTPGEALDETFLPLEPGLEAYRDHSWAEDYVEDHFL